MRAKRPAVPAHDGPPPHAIRRPLRRWIQPSMLIGPAPSAMTRMKPPTMARCSRLVVSCRWNSTPSRPMGYARGPWRHGKSEQRERSQPGPQPDENHQAPAQLDEDGQGEEHAWRRHAEARHLGHSRRNIDELDAAAVEIDGAQAHPCHKRGVSLRSQVREWHFKRHLANRLRIVCRRRRRRPVFPGTATCGGAA